jgi:ABC-type transport system substrate-binding protein
MYANKAVDDLLKAARSETDPAKAQDDLSKLNALIAADYPAVFIDAPDFLYTLPKEIKGVSIFQIASPSDRFANVEKWYRNSELVWPLFARKSE